MARGRTIRQGGKTRKTASPGAISSGSAHNAIYGMAGLLLLAHVQPRASFSRQSLLLAGSGDVMKNPFVLGNSNAAFKVHDMESAV